jgi:hypothetical protein
MDKMDYQKGIDLYIIVLSILFLLTRTKYMSAHLKTVILGENLTIPVFLRKIANRSLARDLFV